MSPEGNKIHFTGITDQSKVFMIIRYASAIVNTDVRIDSLAVKPADSATADKNRKSCSFIATGLSVGGVDTQKLLVMLIK